MTTHAFGRAPVCYKLHDFGGVRPAGGQGSCPLCPTLPLTFLRVHRVLEQHPISLGWLEKMQYNASSRDSHILISMSACGWKGHA